MYTIVRKRVKEVNIPFKNVIFSSETAALDYLLVAFSLHLFSLFDKEVIKAKIENKKTPFHYRLSKEEIEDFETRLFSLLENLKKNSQTIKDFNEIMDTFTREENRVPYRKNGLDGARYFEQLLSLLYFLRHKTIAFYDPFFFMLAQGHSSLFSLEKNEIDQLPEMKDGIKES